MGLYEDERYKDKWALCALRTSLAVEAVNNETEGTLREL